MTIELLFATAIEQQTSNRPWLDYKGFGRFGSEPWHKEITDIWGFYSWLLEKYSCERLDKRDFQNKEKTILVLNVKDTMGDYEFFRADGKLANAYKDGTIEDIYNRFLEENDKSNWEAREDKNVMQKMNIPFSPPDISDLEVEEVTKALKSGWITTGPRVKKLEKLLAEYVGVPTEAPNCVCLNSQTACGELSLRLLGIGPQEGGSAEDEVITCAYTYTASASIVCHVGAKLVLVDCQKDNLEMDYDALEKAINEHTKAIIPIDIGGVPCDYDRIFEIVERKKHLFKPTSKLQKALGRIAVVEDAAHALGASRKGKMVGSIADFTNFSFHAVKNFTTAEGGAMTWRHIEGIDDAELYHLVQLYSLHGQSKDALNKNKPGMWEYDIVGTWYKCNMTDIMAAIGLKQFERYPSMLARRKEIISKYDAELKPLGVEVLPHFTDEHISSGHLYITRVPNCDDQKRREIIIKLAEKGISTNVHYKPLPMHTAYKKLGFDIKDYPNAYARYANEITLPLHTCLTDEEVDYIVKGYREVLR